MIILKNNKDNKKRILFKKTELNQKIIKMLLIALENHQKLNFKNWNLETEQTYFQFKYYLLSKLLNFNKNSFYTRISNRCIWTGRSKSVYSKYKISRITFKKLCSKGLIPGYYKYSW